MYKALYFTRPGNRKIWWWWDIGSCKITCAHYHLLLSLEALHELITGDNFQTGPCIVTLAVEYTATVCTLGYSNYYFPPWKQKINKLEQTKIYTRDNYGPLCGLKNTESAPSLLSFITVCPSKLQVIVSLALFALGVHLLYQKLHHIHYTWL